jgi:hypothetical protein
MITIHCRLQVSASQMMMEPPMSNLGPLRHRPPVDVTFISNLTFVDALRRIRHHEETFNAVPYNTQEWAYSVISVSEFESMACSIEELAELGRMQVVEKLRYLPEHFDKLRDIQT